VDVPAALAEISTLSIEERLSIVEAIWDTIAADSEQLPLTPAQQALIEQRLAAHAADPDAVVAWEDVKAQALARSRV
jgi:putative addiction module component (TIGR02574 family)